MEMFLREFNPADDPDVGYHAPTEDARTTEQVENDSLLASCPPEVYEMDAWAGEVPINCAYAEIGEMAGTNLRLASEYRAAGNAVLAAECQSAANALYNRWAQVFVTEILGPYMP
jgi:hypothetical protein